MSPDPEPLPHDVSDNMYMPVLRRFDEPDQQEEPPELNDKFEADDLRSGIKIRRLRCKVTRQAKRIRELVKKCKSLHSLAAANSFKRR